MPESVIQRKSFQFALEIIDVYSEMQEQREYVLSKQLLRSGTSIGANVEEASGGQSRKDFLAKMY
jgi:four helix bundle protein